MKGRDDQKRDKKRKGKDVMSNGREVIKKWKEGKKNRRMWW
jgi:hypothetical protein